MRRTTSAPQPQTYSAFKTCPRWSQPVGAGAKRVLTVLAYAAVRILFVLAAALAAAQTAAPGAQLQSAGTRNAIVGRVTAADGTPVGGAVVTLLERYVLRGKPQIRFVDVRLQIPTDADGRYTIPQARIGEF